jgi:hypothetical protein
MDRHRHHRAVDAHAAAASVDVVKRDGGVYLSSMRGKTPMKRDKTAKTPVVPTVETTLYERIRDGRVVIKGLAERRFFLLYRESASIAQPGTGQSPPKALAQFGTGRSSNHAPPLRPTRTNVLSTSARR